MTDWLNVPENIEEYVGFIYEIENLISGLKYIGQKKFWVVSHYKPLKGNKKRRKRENESNWRTYYGSSKMLLEDLKKVGKENFKRTILYCCESKSVMNYIETMLQFENHVVFNDSYYNKIVNCRISENQIKNFRVHLLTLIASRTPHKPSPDNNPTIGS